MRKGLAWVLALLYFPAYAAVQQQQKPQPLPPAPKPKFTPLPPPAPPPTAPAGSPTERLTLDDAIRLALQHNHALQAARTIIWQSQSQEITANLRPNPVLTVDGQFLPFFQPSQFNTNFIDENSEFDAGIQYTVERGRKRQHRLQAARDVTSVTRSQVSDNERQLIFNTGQQFVSVLLAESTLDFANQDLGSFQKVLDISQAQYQAGSLSQGDLLKIKLQLLQFQTDVSSAELAKIQAIAGLRQFVGFESVPDSFDVQGDLEYQPVHGALEDFKTLALMNRPDLRAAREGIIAARSQEALAEANGKQDLSVTFDYQHVVSTNTGAMFFSIPLAIFDRNQGEIRRTRYAITQAEQQATETTQQVVTDVVDAYQALHTNDQIVQLYQSGYLDQAKQSRDISEYAFRHGAASLLDFLDSERTYRATQLAYRQALASYMSAVEQMRQAAGTRNLP